ncbi:DUF4224 domain-containing protein [Massilia varians]|uniref:DUF4224 domain-containing protein n=1 Tax=Massilia varians TaxID=457921 RepID=UPI0025539A5F|nr:DUF4224 domain-containing protein [Massilia varians]MDK6078963.1 DUF4224 domain-containing protein [Massilia varians]
MTAIFEMPLPSETLSPDEISDISGCSRKSDQIDWLMQNGWVFIKNRAGAPIIGRLYARLKLAGINPAALAAPEASGWQLDTSTIR